MVSEFKLELERRLLNRQVYSKRINPKQIITRCPSCGDSRKNKNTGHLYVRINVNDNYPIVYNCFKCPFHGTVNEEVLEMLGISDENIFKGIRELNKNADNISTLKYDNEDVRYNYILPKVKNIKKIEYIERRLGIRLEDDDFEYLGIITSLRDFLVTNKIKSISLPKSICKKIEDKYVGFISSNHTCILFRDITGTEKDYSWVKYKINTESQSNGRLFYSIPTEVDITSFNRIIVNLSEGVMDCISVAFNLDNIDIGIINIAVLGKKYDGVLKHLIQLGIFGSNVEVNIYSDNDSAVDTKVEYYAKIFKDLKHLFGKFLVHYNLKEKDCGTKKENILLQTKKI